jgi:MFS family permease
MKEILRNTLAAMAGALTGIVLIMLCELVASRVYPLPAGVNPADKAAMAEFMRSVPAGALGLILFGYFLGVLGGGWVAGRLSQTHGSRQARMVAVLFALASLMNLMSFPHPVWFWVANFVAVIAGAWLAVKLLPRAAESV